MEDFEDGERLREEEGVECLSEYGGDIVVGDVRGE